jgi:hypothetical protein
VKSPRLSVPGEYVGFSHDQSYPKEPSLPDSIIANVDPINNEDSLDNTLLECYFGIKEGVMNNPKAKQDNLNRLFTQILKIDEDGKDFLKKIVTQAGNNRSFVGMPDPIKEPPDENRLKTGVEP